VVSSENKKIYYFGMEKTFSEERVFSPEGGRENMSLKWVKTRRKR